MRSGRDRADVHQDNSKEMDALPASGTRFVFANMSNLLCLRPGANPTGRRSPNECAQSRCNQQETFEDERRLLKTTSKLIRTSQLFNLAMHLQLRPTIHSRGVNISLPINPRTFAMPDSCQPFRCSRGVRAVPTFSRRPALVLSWLCVLLCFRSGLRCFPYGRVGHKWPTSKARDQDCIGHGVSYTLGLNSSWQPLCQWIHAHPQDVMEG